jgi:hypothetical protein
MRKKSLLAASLAFTMIGLAPVNAQTAPDGAVSAPAVPAVGMRAGAHTDFDRVVFDWPRAVKFQLHRDGSHAVLSFDGAANIKFDHDSAIGLTRARGFATHKDDTGHVTVSFTINPEAAIKTFSSSSSVVIDITGKAAPEVVASTPATPTEAPQVTAPVTAPMGKTAAPQVNQPALSSPLLTSPAQATVPAAAQPTTLLPAPAKAAPVPTPAAATAPLSTAKVAVKPTIPAVPATAVTPPKKANDLNGLNLSITPSLVAALDPHIATRATIYQRAETGYIVFDHKLTLSAAALSNSSPLLIDLQLFDMPKNSGYRFPLPPNTELRATLDGTVWKLFLSRKQSDVAVTTALVAQPDFALGARFLLPLPDAPDPIHMTDPVIGDNLILIPLAQSEAFNVERRMSDFTILPAAQGMVIKPLTDKVIVRNVSDGIEITAEGGLLLSRATDTGASQQSATKARAAAAGKSIFDFATWAGKLGESFTQTRQRLQQTIVDVPESERNRARLELARFYFANGNGEEAVAMLNALSKQIPDLRVHADFLSLLGASDILSYRADDGLRELNAPVLTGQPEIELWQAVGLAEQRDWQNAEEKFAITESILTGYPEPFFSRFFVLAIESALANGKDHEAADWLNYVTNAPHSPSIDPALSYLRGVLHAKAGRATAAEQSWQEARTSHDRLYKVRAELALIDLGVSTGSLTPAQAADRLEALRFGWRGDDLEVDILHRLGQFYIEAKNVKAGLNVLAQAVALYPSSPLTPKIHTEMQDTFHSVFLGELGKKLSPLDSLTLYQQYRDLMPTGKDGDTIMRNLAERLVAVDLLDQAAILLEDLAKNRLQGEDKQHAALRLAGIQLLNHKPSEAIAALDLTATETMQQGPQNERILLRARALSELHRDADATALLKDNSSEGAKMLRADIAMHAQEWADAAKALMDLVGPPPPSGKVLTTDQSAWLVNAAIAYALANDQTGLDRLAIDYSSVMTTSTQNDTFRMLTQPEKTGQLRDLAAAQSQISQVDMFQGFLNNYRTGPTDASAPKKP